MFIIYLHSQYNSPTCNSPVIAVSYSRRISYCAICNVKYQFMFHTVVWCIASNKFHIIMGKYTLQLVSEISAVGVV